MHGASQRAQQQMGHGVKQRDLVVMSPEEVEPSCTSVAR